MIRIVVAFILFATVTSGCKQSPAERVSEIQIGMTRRQVIDLMGEPEGLDYFAGVIYAEKHPRRRITSVDDWNEPWNEASQMASDWYYSINYLSGRRGDSSSTGLFSGQADLIIKFGSSDRVEQIIDWGGLSPLPMWVKSRKVIKKTLDPHDRHLYP